MCSQWSYRMVCFDTERLLKEAIVCRLEGFCGATEGNTEWEEQWLHQNDANTVLLARKGAS